MVVALTDADVGPFLAALGFEFYRHTEIPTNLIRKICRGLGIPETG